MTIFSEERRKRPLGRFLLFFLICILIANSVSLSCFAAGPTISSLDNFQQQYGTVNYQGSNYTVYNCTLAATDTDLTISVKKAIDGLRKKQYPAYNFYFCTSAPEIGSSITDANSYGTWFTKNSTQQVENGQTLYNSLPENFRSSLPASEDVDRLCFFLMLYGQPSASNKTKQVIEIAGIVLLECKKAPQIDKTELASALERVSLPTNRYTSGDRYYGI